MIDMFQNYDHPKRTGHFDSPSPFFQIFYITCTHAYTYTISYHIYIYIYIDIYTYIGLAERASSTISTRCQRGRGVHAANRRRKQRICAGAAVRSSRAASLSSHSSRYPPLPDSLCLFSSSRSHASQSHDSPAREHRATIA